MKGVQQVRLLAFSDSSIAFLRRPHRDERTGRLVSRLGLKDAEARGDATDSNGLASAFSLSTYSLDRA